MQRESWVKIVIPLQVFFSLAPPGFDKTQVWGCHIFDHMLVGGNLGFAWIFSDKAFRREKGDKAHIFLHSGTKMHWFHLQTIFECDVNFCGLRRVSTRKKKSKKLTTNMGVFPSTLHANVDWNVSRKKRLKMSRHAGTKVATLPKPSSLKG